ncbi:hypothetical protein BBJ28_00021230, partial [Nothophytophthora sp. Chile5]
SLIKSTLAEYDQFVVHDRKRVDSKRWKPVRTREEVVIYRERAREAETGGHPSHHSAPGGLALYSGTPSSKGSRRVPATTTNAAATDSRAALYRTMSFSGGRSFGLVATPRKEDASHVEMDPTEDGESDNETATGASSSAATLSGLSTATFALADESGSVLPRMLAVGALRGSLDDVMYGVVSPNAASVRLRSSYLGDDIADCAVLREIKVPSGADPFRFLGIKWLVRAKSRGAASRIVLPRDFVVLEHSGVMMRPDGSRVGFHLLHSVEIPTCRELREHRILRAKLSSCYIYEETRSNRVQVFMTASVAPKGHVFERMAMRSAATALSSCWKSVLCAHNKKLAFCLQNERPSGLGSFRGGALPPLGASTGDRGSGSTLDRESRRSTNYSAMAGRRQCGVCRGKLGVLTKASRCQLCSEQVCHRCRLVRKLSSDTLTSQVTKAAIVFCKKCVASVSDESALEIARQELWDTRARGRGRTRASSAASGSSSRHSFSSERNTYASVVLGRGSELSSRSSATTSSLNFSRGPTSNVQEDPMGYSVGPPASTPMASPPLRRASTTPAKQLSFSMSMGPLSDNTGTTEALSLADLDLETAESGKVPSEPEEEPVMLDHRMTMTIRSLRHVDYVLSGDSELDDELESGPPSEVGDPHDLESGDEAEERESVASSVAVLDDDYDLRMSETPTYETASHSEAEDAIKEEDEEQEEAKAAEPQHAGEDVEVVEAAPIAEVHAVMLSSDHDQPQPEAKPEVKPRVDELEEMAVMPRVRRAHTTAPSAAATSAYQHQLYQQMQDLHDVVESTYQVAKANTEAVFKDRDSGRLPKASTTAAGSLRGVRTFSQPFAFNVVGLRSTRAMTVGINK